MVKVETLTVGKELLVGRTVNTNAHWVGGRMARMGSMLRRVATVDDDLDEISSAIHEALARSPDFIVVIGGLGPTPDDMTLKGIALGLQRRVKEDPRALEMVRRHYEQSRKRAGMTPARRKMAELPSGSVPLSNRVGTAPGVRIEEGETVIFALPGVPAEMKSIFRESVEPEISAKVGRLHRRQEVLHLKGAAESSLAPGIGSVMRMHPDAYIKSHPKGDEDGKSVVELDITVVRRTVEEAVSEAEAIASQLAAEAERAGAKVRRGPRGGGRA